MSAPTTRSTASGATYVDPLYPFQKEILGEVLGRLKKPDADEPLRLVVHAPTGAGKTLLATAITEDALERGLRVLFIVPALELVEQTIDKLLAEGIAHVGAIQAQHDLTNPAQPVQVASVQTLSRREMPAADLVIIDEAHRVLEAYSKWLKADWAGVPVIGLSATPWTRGLGKLFDDLLVAATTQQLIDEGYLCKFRVFAPSHPDLSGVRTTAGDYNVGDLGDAADQKALVADVVETWLERAANRPTLCFAVDRAHAKNLQQQFEAAGVSAAYMDAFTDLEERKRIKRGFHDGSIQVVCNVGVLTTGVDWDVRCISLARPTKSEILFVQIIGRGLRTAAGKDDCLILDHSDTHIRLGFVTDIHRDQLDCKDGSEAKKRDSAPLPKACPKCAFLRPPKVHECPVCGFKPEVRSTVICEDGELLEITRGVKPAEWRRQFLAGLRYIAEERGYKPGWATYKFKEKTGEWPNGLDHTRPEPPTAETRAWVKSRLIAFAKRRAA